MIVVDVSLWLDLFVKAIESQFKLAEEFFYEVEEPVIYEPMLFKVELTGILARYNPRNIVEQLVDEVTWLRLK